MYRISLNHSFLEPEARERSMGFEIERVIGMGKEVA
jgi:hypothetical protein